MTTSNKSDSLQPPKGGGFSPTLLIKGITEKDLIEEKAINEGKGMTNSAFNHFYNKELKGFEWEHIMTYGRRIFAGIAWSAGAKAERDRIIELIKNDAERYPVKEYLIHHIKEASL